MPLKSWPETSLSVKRPDIRTASESGSITLMTVFVFFLFSSIGLGLCFLARTYREWSACKTDAILLAGAAENGVRAGFNDLIAALAARRFPLELTDLRYAGLRAATLDRKTDLVEEILGLPLPLRLPETAGELAWSADTDFEVDRLTDGISFIAVDFLGTIDARGRLARRPRGKRTALDVGLSTAAGRIPLAAFPFLIAGEDGPERMSALIAEKKVVLAPLEGNRVGLPAAAVGRNLIPRDAAPLLAETLKIKMFTPDRIPLSALRKALGLPAVDEPVPDGAYLIVDETGLGGIFVQGDVEEMVLGAAGGRQAVQFRLEGGTWRVWFSPSENRTGFESPAETRVYDGTPRTIIMVNGKISSLGGGIVNPDGSLTLSDRTDIPSILAGIPMTIVSSGETVLTSHLIQEGVQWRQGLPYLKDSTARLFIYASGADLIDGTQTVGLIRVDEDAPSDLFLQAALTAADGIRIDGSGKTVTVSGGVQAAAVDPGGSRMNIIPDGRLPAALWTSESAPRSTVPVVFVTGLEALRWTDR